MSKYIKRHIVGDHTINLYDIVAYTKKEETLIIYTLSETLYFNAPDDINNAQAEFDELDSLMTELEDYQIEVDDLSKDLIQKQLSAP